MRFMIVSVVLVACSSVDDRDDGTVVGNPGETSFRVADPEDFEPNGARLGVDAVTWTSCRGSDQVQSIDDDIDLLDEEQSIDAPNGEWCSVVVSMTGPLVLEVSVDWDDVDDEEEDWDDVDENEERSIYAVLDVPELVLVNSDGFSVDESMTVLELASPGWVSLGDLLDSDDWEEDEEGAYVFVSDGSLIESVADGSGLFHDRDGDGFVGSEERESGPLASGDQHPDNPSDPQDGESETVDAGSAEVTTGSGDLQTGGGCGRSESNLNVAFLVPLVVFGCRRFSSN